MSMTRSPLGPIEIVRANDANEEPAIDREKMTHEDLLAYYQTHDESLLRLRDGIEPVRFVVKPISRMYLANEIEPRGAFQRQCALAFLVACHEIKIPGETESMKPETKDLRRSSEYGVDIAPASWVEDVAARFGIETVYEIGGAAIRRARLANPTAPSSG